MERPLVVSFVGASGVGKTTLVERVVPLLRASGLRVGTVKHAGHGFEVDRAGSDSWRHREAGAERVLLLGPSGAVLFLAGDGPSGPGGSGRHHRGDGADDAVRRLSGLVAAHLADLDVVLAEGYAPDHDALVEVRRRAVAPKRHDPTSKPWLVVSDEPMPGHPGHVALGDAAAVAERIAALAAARTR